MSPIARKLPTRSIRPSKGSYFNTKWRTGVRNGAGNALGLRSEENSGWKLFGSTRGKDMWVVMDIKRAVDQMGALKILFMDYVPL